MKHIVWKAYWDFEKEEKWLNEMAAKGMALSDYSWCRYVFTEAPDNEYTYRIQLLRHKPDHPESIAYIRFMEESGVEFVASYWYWIFLRKKSSDGSFDIFSDIDSRIDHYKRISIFLGSIGALNLFVFLMGIVNLAVQENHGLAGISLLNILNGIIAAGFTWLVSGYIRKIIRLKKEKLIYE